MASQAHGLEHLCTIFDVIKPAVINRNRILNSFQNRLCAPTMESSLPKQCARDEQLKSAETFAVAFCSWAAWLRVLMLKSVYSVSSSLHGLTIHSWFQNIFLCRSAVVRSWWISLPWPRDLCLSELAVRWGPWLPWRVRWVFSHLWVERLFAFAFGPLWNQMSVASTDHCCSSWLYFYVL